MKTRALLATSVTLVLGLVTGTVAQGDYAPMKNVFPADLQWRNLPSVPRAIELAVVYGDPTKPGPYVFRARMPAGTELPPHRHPDERWVTVLQGIYRSAAGENFDVEKATEYPTGSFYVTGANVPHYSYAVTDVIVQEQGTGPTGMDYVHAHDDPRNAR